ncbi:chalcone isomerase family protein [Hafnia psychrotolerans]|uniref:Chalcone isomerase domain-containing protein n=1 Tax=Hafnia psychrotolerans TaxID=1477018 RepID=A0ABQ1FVQ7_9GAMM|nr:hypothetical protein [Hafnia psychrotolerans]GGA32109.1 hypothetical protein GCM10011328_03580 [Hafnia psychrotolerans]
MKHIAIAALALIFSCATFASTPWDHWQRVGRATLSWGPFDVYHSTLLTPDGKYQAQQWPLALAIDYLRSIDRQELAKATEDQWQALGLVNTAKKNGWLNAVENTWPDVREGSEIVFVADAQGGQFYSRAPGSVIVSPIGKPFSPEFRDAFLAIWLSPGTQYPDLRSKLTGATASD